MLQVFISASWESTPPSISHPLLIDVSPKVGRGIQGGVVLRRGSYYFSRINVNLSIHPNPNIYPMINSKCDLLVTNRTSPQEVLYQNLHTAKEPTGYIILGWVQKTAPSIRKYPEIIEPITKVEYFSKWFIVFLFPFICRLDKNSW